MLDIEEDRPGVGRSGKRATPYDRATEEELDMTPEDRSIRMAVFLKVQEEGADAVCASAQSYVVHPFDSDDTPPKRKLEKTIRQLSAEASLRLRGLSGEEAFPVAREALESYRDAAREAKDLHHTSRFSYMVGRIDGASGAEVP